MVNTIFVIILYSIQDLFGITELVIFDNINNNDNNNNNLIIIVIIVLILILILIILIRI